MEEGGRWRLTTPVTVFEDLLIVGGFTSEGYGAIPGDIRAFDARTGEMTWVFKTIPEQGEYGADDPLPFWWT